MDLGMYPEDLCTVVYVYIVFSYNSYHTTYNLAGFDLTTLTTPQAETTPSGQNRLSTLIRSFSICIHFISCIEFVVQLGSNFVGIRFQAKFGLCYTTSCSDSLLRLPKKWIASISAALTDN
jgi:hypothetical protein